MAFFRVPSQAMIKALGWEAIEEIDRYLDDVAEEIRAEGRRLEASRQAALFPPGREADMLHRLADAEYHLREEISLSGQRIRRAIYELKDELRRLREALSPPQPPAT